MKRVFVAFFAALFFLFGIPVSALADTGIIAELEAATVGGQPFDFADYPKKDNGEMEFIALSEVGYTQTGAGGNYALYLYIYNPTEKSIVTSGKNSVTLAVQFDDSGIAAGYEKFDLAFVEASDNNRFLKFRIVDHISAYDGKKISQRVDRDARKYVISEVEIQHLGQSNATAISVGQVLTFVGYSASDSLTLITRDFEVLEIDDLHFTNYRTATSSLGVGHQNQLTSAYFLISKEYIQKYGELIKLKCMWNEQKTAPIVVLSDKAVYDGLLPYLGVEIGEYNDNVPYCLYSGYEGYGGISHFSWSYNIEQGAYFGLSPAMSERICTRLSYLFYAEDIEAGEMDVSAEELLDYIQAHGYADWLFSDEVDEGRTQGENVVEIGVEDFELKSFGSSHNWWSTFWNYTIKGIDAYEDLKIAPIREVTLDDVAETKSDADIAAALYISEEDVPALRLACSQAALTGDSVWLFRFAATDYYTEDVYSKTLGVLFPDGYYAEQTVFLDFDIIELTLSKEGVSTIIPVSIDSRDYVGGVTAPTDIGSDLSWVKVVIGLVALIVLILVLWNPIIKLIESFGGLINNTAADVGQLKRNVQEKRRKGKRK